MPSGRTALAQGRPDAARALDDALEQAYAAGPDGLLDLCRARVHTLLGGEITAADPRLRAVADYARSDLFDDTERLAIEFAEQYVLDVANMPDDLVAALRDRLGTERPLRPRHGPVRDRPGRAPRAQRRRPPGSARGERRPARRAARGCRSPPTARRTRPTSPSCPTR